MMIRRIALGLTAVMAAGVVCAQQGQGGRVPFRSTQEAVQYYENLVGRLAQQVRSMQDDNAMLAESNSELKQRVSRLEAEFRSMSEEMTALRKQIAADAEARKNQLNRLADSLTVPSGKTEHRSPRPVRPKHNEPAEENGDYIEHTVEAGTTLTALAKAYGVTVKDIIRANKLSKPTIYVGQKLLIPVSKKR